MLFSLLSKGRGSYYKFIYALKLVVLQSAYCGQQWGYLFLIYSSLFACEAKAGDAETLKSLSHAAAYGMRHYQRGMKGHFPSNAPTPLPGQLLLSPKQITHLLAPAHNMVVIMLPLVPCRTVTPGVLP